MSRELEAVFYFDGAGLYVTGDGLGKSAQFEINGIPVTLSLPNRDEVFSLAASRSGVAGYGQGCPADISERRREDARGRGSQVRGPRRGRWPS